MSLATCGLLAFGVGWELWRRREWRREGRAAMDRSKLAQVVQFIIELHRQVLLVMDEHL
jgi:hypothetical protein